MRWNALLIALLMMTAGCFGASDAPGETGDDPAGDDTFAPPEDDAGEAGNGTADTGDDPADDADTSTGEDTPPSEWSEDERTGTVQGATLGDERPGAVTETFTVAEGTLDLALNLTTEGGELEMRIAGPDCELGDDCTESTTTSEGEGQYTLTEPAPGEYTVELSPSDPPVGEIQYTLVIATLQPTA